MSSSKTIGIIGGGQLGQMMAISPMSLKMLMLTVWMLLSRIVSSLKGQTYSAFRKIVFLKRTSF